MYWWTELYNGFILSDDDPLNSGIMSTFHWLKWSIAIIKRLRKYGEMKVGKVGKVCLFTTKNTDRFTSSAGGSLPGLCDFRKDVLRLLNKRLVQDRKPAGQQGGPGGFHADGRLVIEVVEVCFDIVSLWYWFLLSSHVTHYKKILRYELTWEIATICTLTSSPRILYTSALTYRLVLIIYYNQ